MPLLRDDIEDFYAERGRSMRATAIDMARAMNPDIDPDLLGMDDSEPAPTEWPLWLGDSALWWVARPMAQIVAAAAPDLQEAGEWNTAWMPAPRGILVWEGGMGTIRARDSDQAPAPRPLAGLLWNVDDDGLHTVYLVGDDSPMGMRPIWNWKPTQAPEVDPEDAERANALLVTTWLLATQPNLGRIQTAPSTLRRPGRPRRPREVATVTVRELGRTSDHSADSQETGRHVSVRFLVRGHWRNQAWGPGRALRRPTWISPYLKGPDDGPMQDTDVVNTWR